jgi:hypothetical protein
VGRAAGGLAGGLGVGLAGCDEIAGAGSLELATAVESDGSAGGGLGTEAAVVGGDDRAALLSR